MNMKLNLAEFRKINTQRAVEGFKTYENVPLSFWGCAIAGEVGELCNIIKKLDRVQFGGIDAGNSYKAADVTPEMIKDEIGGIAIYLDLLASLFKLSLEDSIIETFNSKSEQYNFIKYETPDGEWISVEDRLPEAGTEVMTWVEHYNDIPIQVYYSTTGKNWHGSRELEDCMNDGFVQDSRLTSAPTHWMPLPSPPKK
jgi:NTP pyrophosphatase (non-canonical NTP hydrolase)